MERERPQVHLERSPTRCPYCHDDVGQEELERALVCQQCLARHHADCWQGTCANCSHTHALAPVARAERTRPAGAEDTLYERTKRWTNRAYAAAFLLYVLVSFLTIPFMPEPPPGDAPASIPLFMVPMLGMALVVSLLCFPLMGVNAYDAVVRRRRDGRTSWLALALAWTGLCSGGLTSFCYYLRWGHAPLPTDPSAPRRAPPTK